MEPKANMDGSNTDLMYMSAELLSSLSKLQEPALLLTPSSSHNLISWVNPAFSKQFGWTFGQVLGYEMFCLHGDAANVIPLAKRFKEIEKNFSTITDIEQNLYTMDGTLVKSQITVFPVMEPTRASNAAPSNKQSVAFICLKISQINNCPFPLDLLFPLPKIFEVGLPLDRREYCKHYVDYYGPATSKNSFFDAFHFRQFCGKATLTNTISLMMISPDNMLLCNRNGQIVGASSTWCKLFGFEDRMLVGMTLNDVIGRIVDNLGAWSRFNSALASVYADGAMTPREEATPLKPALLSSGIGIPNFSRALSVSRDSLYGEFGSARSMKSEEDPMEGYTLRLHCKSPLSSETLGHDISPITVAYARDCTPQAAMFSKSVPLQQGRLLKKATSVETANSGASLLSMGNINATIANVSSNCTSAFRVFSDKFAELTPLKIPTDSPHNSGKVAATTSEADLSIATKPLQGESAASSTISDGSPRFAEFCEYLATTKKSIQTNFLISFCPVQLSSNQSSERLVCILFVDSEKAMH